MWKAILWGLGIAWGLRAIPLLCIAFVSTFWFFDPKNNYFHDPVTGIIAVITTGLTIYESATLISKITRK